MAVFNPALGEDARKFLRGDHPKSSALRKWTIADRYIDSGFSGSKDFRPELNRLMLKQLFDRHDKIGG